VAEDPKLIEEHNYGCPSSRMSISEVFCTKGPIPLMTVNVCPGGQIVIDSDVPVDLLMVLEDPPHKYGSFLSLYQLSCALGVRWEEVGIALLNFVNDKVVREISFEGDHRYCLADEKRCIPQLISRMREANPGRRIGLFYKEGSYHPTVRGPIS